MLSSNMTLAIGNTYNRVPSHEVTLDRTGRFRKVHEFTLYVDVLVPENDPGQKGSLENVIDRVTFDLGSTFHGSPYICYCPIPVKNKNGKAAWRFHTRHAAYGSVTAAIEVRGVAGKAEEFQHDICLNSHSVHAQKLYPFSEARRPRPLRPVPLPADVKFGVELECTTSKTLAEIQTAIPVECPIIQVHSQGRQTTSTWKLVPDSSVACNLNNPNCTTFELVSPVLVGGPGLADISKICDALKDQDTQLNKSAGFHVHINVEQYSLKQIIKICQQYIKYEGVFDTLVPPSRRTGSAESNRFFKSNRDAVGRSLTPHQRNQALANCTSMEQLASLMNAPGNDRYYKLNLQNLCTGRQPTIEFRQHSATVNYEKIASWVRMCYRFCHISATTSPPKSFLSTKSNHHKFQALFWYVVKDRTLKDKYKQRQKRLRDGSQDEDSCCTGCATGSTCATHRQRSRRGRLR